MLFLMLKVKNALLRKCYRNYIRMFMNTATLFVLAGKNKVYISLVVVVAVVDVVVKAPAENISTRR